MLIVGESPSGRTRGHLSYTGCTTREGNACCGKPGEVCVTASRDEAKHCRSGAGSAIWLSLTAPKASGRPIDAERDIAARIIFEIVSGEPAREREFGSAEIDFQKAAGAASVVLFVDERAAFEPER
jgi:hypothetical protein